MPGQPAVNSNPFITFDVSSDITIHELPAPNVLGDPASIIPTSSGFRAEVNFDLAGLFALYIAGTGAPYTVTLRAESLGGGFEGDLGSKSGFLVPGQTSYGHGHPNQVAVDVPAGSLSPGVYRLAAVVTFTTDATHPVHPPMYGFADGPVIEIYNP